MKKLIIILALIPNLLFAQTGGYDLVCNKECKAEELDYQKHRKIFLKKTHYQYRVLFDEVLLFIGKLVMMHDAYEARKEAEKNSKNSNYNL